MQYTIDKKVSYEQIAIAISKLNREFTRVYMNSKEYKNNNIAFLTDIYNETYFEWSFIFSNETQRHVWRYYYKTKTITKSILNDLAQLKDKSCPRCCNLIFESNIQDYDFQCFFCDQDFYNIEGGY